MHRVDKLLSISRSGRSPTWRIRHETGAPAGCWAQVSEGSLLREGVCMQFTEQWGLRKDQPEVTCLELHLWENNVMYTG